MSIWRMYYEGLTELADTGEIILPVIPEGCHHNAHMFYIKCKDLRSRTEFISFMKAKEIGCVFHYIPLHSAPAGIKYGRFNGEDTFTTAESERLVRLPMYYGLPEDNVQYIISSVKEFYS